MFEKIFGEKQITKKDIAAVVVLLLALIALFYFNPDYSQIISQSQQIETGYLVNQMNESDYYYIDNGKSRVVGIKKDKVSFMLSSGGEGSFYQAEDLCVDPSDNSFYVLSVDWDLSGYLLASERILHYDANGNYMETVYEELYQPSDEVNKHRLFDLRMYGDEISFVRADDTSVCLCKVKAGNVYSQEKYPFADAWVYLQNFAHDDAGHFYGIDKRGRILSFADEKDTVFYESPENSEEVLYDLDIDSDGEVVYVDIYQGRICKVDSRNSSTAILTQGSVTGQECDGIGAEVSNVFCSKNAMATIYNGSAVFFGTDGTITKQVASFSKGAGMWIENAIAIVILLLHSMILVYVLLRALFYFRIHRPVVSMSVILEVMLIVYTIFLSAGIISGVSVPFEHSYFESTTGQLKDMALTGANRFEPRWLEGVHNAKDFMNGDYKNISKLMHDITTDNHDADSRYGAEIDIVDSEGRAYALCYTDNSIGTYFPLDEWTKQEVQKIMDTGIATESEPTVSAGGTFLFGRAPIYDGDRVVGVFAVAQDNFRVKESFNNVILNIIISVILALIAIIFLFNEGFTLVPQWRQKNRKGGPTIGGHPIPLHMLRIMAFTIAFVLNMTSSFLSVYTSSFWRESLGIPESLAGAIPLFANAILVAVSALFCPVLLRKLGFRDLTAIGILCSASGDCLAGFSNGYVAIVMALFLNGAGFGILMNSISIAISMIDQSEHRQVGFAGYNAGYVAGTNSGMIFGSFLAGVLAYNQVFYVTTALWLAQMILFVKVGKEIISKETINKENIGKKSSGKKYVGNVQNRGMGKKKLPKYPISGLIYVLIISVPYAMIGSFQYYYIPILSERLGYNEKYASLLMVIFAICGVLLGNTLSLYMWKQLKRRAIYPAVLMALTAWLIIAWTSDLRIIGAAMVLLGVSFSFGLSVMVEAYLQIGQVKKLGEDTAMSIYNFATGIGQSFSSIVCGLILGAGMLFGMSVFAGICVIFLVVYWLFYRQEVE